jgi:hypothetical protein
MTQIRTPLLLCIALLASASALAAGVPENRASPSSATGVYSLTFNLNLSSTMPAGTTITCRARIVPNKGVTDPWGQQFPAIPVRTVIGRGATNGSTATCAQEIPIYWAVANERDGAVLSFEIDAVSNTGSIPVLVRSRGQQNVPVAYPASGGSARLSFNLAF